MVISSSVVANARSPPEIVDCESGNKAIAVVGLMVLANPGSNKSPHCFPGWISTNSGNFLRFSSYIRQQYGVTGTKEKYLPRVGLFQRFLGASLAVNGV